MRKQESVLAQQTASENTDPTRLKKSTQETPRTPAEKSHSSFRKNMQWTTFPRATDRPNVVLSIENRGPSTNRQNKIPFVAVDQNLLIGCV